METTQSIPIFFYFLTFNIIIKYINSYKKLLANFIRYQVAYFIFAFYTRCFALHCLFHLFEFIKFAKFRHFYIIFILIKLINFLTIKNFIIKKW